MRPIRLSALLLCTLVAVTPAGLLAAEKKPAKASRAKDAPSVDEAREAIRAALKSAVEPVFDAAATAKLAKVGVVVVPNQPTPVERRLASIVIDELDDVFPRPAKESADTTKWDLSGETQAVLTARRDVATSASKSNRPNGTRGSAAPQAHAPLPELTCDGLLAVVCRMKGRDPSVEFALMRAPEASPPAGRAAAAGSRRPVARGADAPGKPLWKGTATLSRSDLAALPDVPDVNLKVLAFAREHVGQQVGNGECWTLAADALNAAGARPAAGYTFGRELRDGEPALPGDVVQFTTVRLQNGRSWQTLGTPNHTAVVVQADGEVYEVLHQNMGGVKKVVSAKLNFAGKTEGKIQIFRPVPLNESKSR